MLSIVVILVQYYAPYYKIGEFRECCFGLVNSLQSSKYLGIFSNGVGQ